MSNPPLTVNTVLVRGSDGNWYAEKRKVYAELEATASVLTDAVGSNIFHFIYNQTWTMSTNTKPSETEEGSYPLLLNDGIEGAIRYNGDTKKFLLRAEMDIDSSVNAILGLQIVTTQGGDYGTPICETKSCCPGAHLSIAKIIDLNPGDELYMKWLTNQGGFQHIMRRNKLTLEEI
jgi:hypothetical protein